MTTTLDMIMIFYRPLEPRHMFFKFSSCQEKYEQYASRQSDGHCRRAADAVLDDVLADASLFRGGDGGGRVPTAEEQQSLRWAQLEKQTLNSQ